jgi:cyclopropane-fatty-acyl-phospholipid synthase
LVSVRGILDSMTRVTRLSLFHAEDMGAHYARTLSAWRKPFLDSLAQVTALGFGDRFIRMWDYYQDFCEAAFRERHIGDMQLLLTKNFSPKPLFQAPWRCAPEYEEQEALA